MKKNLFIPAIFVLSLLFVGIGCSNTEITANEESDAKNESKMENTLPEKTESGLELKGEVLSNGQVKFNWTKSNSVKTDAKKGFVLVRSDSENPVHDETNFWFRQSALTRETIWKDIPAGKQHFRICALEKEKCSVYSNDVELDVK